MNKHAFISLGIELTVSNILLALEKVIEPQELGIHLGIELHQLKKRHVKYTERQKIEVIKLLLNNNAKCSWETLADAVERMNCHGKVVDSLRELHRRAIDTKINDMQDEVRSHAL